MKTQERWSTARDVAARLGIKPKLAWSILKRLEFDELLPGILEGINEAIELGYEISQQQDDGIKTPLQRKAQDVKLILWAFDKIGDIERIRIAYRKAIEVIS